jgi:hypothetical protein
MLISDRTPDSRDSMLLIGRDSTIPSVELGDPVRTTVYNLCIYDDSAGVPVLAWGAEVPPLSDCSGRRPCWRTLGSRGYFYLDASGAHSGIRVIFLFHNLGQPRMARVLVSARGANVVPPGLPMEQDPMVRVQIKNSEGFCWEDTYTKKALLNRPNQWVDRGD